MIGGTDPEHGAIADALGAIAAHGGPTGLLTALRFAPLEGWSALAGRMADSARLQVRYGAEVRSVRQDDRSVELGLADGTSYRAARVVLALPVNALPTVAFDPASPAGDRRSAGRERGSRAQAVAASPRRAGRRARRRRGRGSSLALRRSRARRRRRAADRLRLRGRELRSRSHADVERALRAFFPDSELVAADHHDWIGVPFSRGTWATATVGRAELLTAERFPPHGRVAFATSDVATDEAGWIEGALVAGAAGARWALAT